MQVGNQRVFVRDRHRANAAADRSCVVRPLNLIRDIREIDRDLILLDDYFEIERRT